MSSKSLEMIEPVVMYRSPASRSDPDSTTASVSSSANNGTPSALAMICSCIPHGNFLPPVTSEMICPVCSRDNRSRQSKVTCNSSSQGGKNSGLKLHNTKTRALLIDAMHRPSSSSVLESIQCASANLITTGRVSARSRTCRTSAAIVRSLAAVTSPLVMDSPQRLTARQRKMGEPSVLQRQP